MSLFFMLWIFVRFSDLFWLFEQTYHNIFLRFHICLSIRPRKRDRRLWGLGEGTFKWWRSQTGSENARLCEKQRIDLYDELKRQYVLWGNKSTLIVLNHEFQKPAARTLVFSAGTQDGEEEQKQEHKDMPRHTTWSRATHATQTQTRNTTSRLGLRKRMNPPQPPIICIENPNAKLLKRQTSGKKQTCWFKRRREHHYVLYEKNNTCCFS